MSNNNSPWGPKNSGGGKSPWGGGNKPSRPRPGENSVDLDNVIKGWADRMKNGGNGGGPNRGGSRRGGSGGPNLPSFLGKFGPFGIIILFALVSMLLSTVYKIDQGQEGVVLRFGEYSRTTAPGLQFKLPDPIETVQKVNIDEERTITIGGDGRENLMLTGDENIAVSYTHLTLPTILLV